MFVDKKINRLLVLLGLSFMLLTVPCKAKAAFPNDLDVKPMKAYSLRTTEIGIYSDQEMTQQIEQVDGDGLLFEAVDVSDDQKALYGTYQNENSGQQGQGWIPSSIFLYDESFSHVYATIRSATTVYTSSSMAKEATEIRKYSGIIALGKANGAVQVIYEKKNSYGIGWIAAEDYDNKLVYDGRDKQILANGTYYFASSTEVDRLLEDTQGGSDGTIPMPASQTYRLTYLGKNMYHIFDVKQNKYISVEEFSMEDIEQAKAEKPEWLSSGPVHVFKMIFSSSYREKNEEWKKQVKEQKAEVEKRKLLLKNGEIYQDETTGLDYMTSLVEDETKASPFYLKRVGDYFSIAWNKGNLYFGNNDKQNAILAMTDQPEGDYLWRVRAVQSLVDPENPMVFTQYDPQWCGKPYGSEGCVGTAGCGLLATVNAVYALTGQYMSVMELRDYAVDKGYRIEGNGTDEGIFKAAAMTYGKKYGFEWDGASGNINRLKKKLQQGDVAVAHVIGHYVAITAYDEKKNKYLLLDSNTLPKRETTAFGDWISPSRLQDGYLYGQNYYFFKLGQ